jgi:hypothetical protein
MPHGHSAIDNLIALTALRKYQEGGEVGRPRAKDYYSVPSEQLLAFTKAVAPYLESSLKDVGSKTTAEDILKRVALGSEPGGIQMVFSNPEEYGTRGRYTGGWAPFIDYETLYKDKSDLATENATPEEWAESVRLMTEESKKQSMLADTIRMYLDPTLRGSSKGVDRLLDKPKVMETMYHELMHTPSFSFDEEGRRQHSSRIRHSEEQFAPTSQYGYTEAIKKHLGEATYKGKRRAGLFYNKPIYVPPKERGALSGRYQYEHIPDYVRDKAPEQGFYNIMMDYFMQDKQDNAQ